MTSTFAPPTGPPVTPSDPFDTPLVPVDGQGPGRRRHPLLLAAGVLAVVALGVGAFVALARSGPARDAAEPYSLLAAAEGTIAARTVEFEVTVSAADLGGVTVSGAVDNESKLASVTTDLSSMLSLGATPVPLGDGELTVLIDGSAGVVYLDAASLGGFLPTDAAWLSVDLEALAEQSGRSLDEAMGAFLLDPTDIATALLDGDGAVEVGLDTIDGTEVRHYEVSVDVAAALAAVPQAGVDPEIADVELPDAIVYDVWVTVDNQLRRVAFDAEIAGQPIGMQLDMTISGEALDVELPDDAFDLTGLLGF